jgi:hypothetical protein
LRPGGISFAVSGLPLGATAVFSPTTITANSPATSVTLTVTLAGKAALQPMRGPFGGASLPVALGLVLLPFAARLRKAVRRLNTMVVLALLSLALAVGVTGCGGNLTPESYGLTVTATSGPLSHTMALKVTIKN